MDRATSSRSAASDTDSEPSSCKTVARRRALSTLVMPYAEWKGDKYLRKVLEINLIG